MLSACCGAGHAGEPQTSEEVTATLRELRGEIQRLEQRVHELERQLAGADDAPPGAADAPAARPGAPMQAGGPTPAPAPAPGWTVAALSTELDVGGRIKADALYSDASRAGEGTSVEDLGFYPGRIPVGAEDDGEETHFSARESRIWVKSHTGTPLGDLAAYVEVDFFTSDATAQARLRHAYGTFAGFTGGQTYTTFMNVAAYPEINDINGPVAIISVRQPLLRWTGEFGWGEIQLAMEEPENQLTLPDGRRVHSDSDRVPDLIAKLRWRGAWGEWSLALMGREIRSRGAVVPGRDDSAWSGSVSVGGRIHVFERDSVRFMASYGNGLGRYLSFGAFSAGQLDAEGRIQLTDAAGGYLAYQRWWNAKLRSTLAFGLAHADYDGPHLVQSENEWLYSTHANLLWSPVFRATLGIEWIHGERETLAGTQGSLDRFQLTAIYTF